MKYKRIYIEGENEDEIVISEDRLIETKIGTPFIDIPYRDTEDRLSGKAIYLDEEYDWVLGKSETGSLICVPLKKTKIRR